MDDHPITKSTVRWHLICPFATILSAEGSDWEDDTDGVPEALKGTVVFVVQGGIGHFSLPFEELLVGSPEPGYDTAAFNRELRQLCFEHVSAVPTNTILGRETALTPSQRLPVLWLPFSPPMILHHDHLVSINLNDHAPSTFSRRARDSCIRLLVTPSLGAG